MIRQILPSDIDEIVAIENKSFPVPFSRELFKAMLGMPPFEGFTAKENDKIVGYIIFSHITNEMELLTVAVDEAFRRKGIAKALVMEMLLAAKNGGVQSIFLEVRPSNAAARALYKGLGFLETGIRRGYYQDNGEDAIVMVYPPPQMPQP